MATDLIYTTNPNEWTRLEGVSVDRRKPDGQIMGASVNVTGILGQCVRGPLVPRLVSDPAEAQAIYGGRDAGGGGAIVGQIWKAFLNRGFSFPCVLCRVAAAGAVAASYEHVTGSDHIIKVAATSVGTWANNAAGIGVSSAVETATDADANHFNLRIIYAGKVYLYENLDVHATGVDNLATVVGGSITNPVIVTKLMNGRPTNVTAVALASGTDGTTSIAKSDFETAFPLVANHPDTNIIVAAEEAYQPYTAIMAAGAEASDLSASQPTKMIVTCNSGAYNDLAADEVTDLGTALTTKSRNIVWCYNPSSTLDQATSTLTEGGSHLDMAAILSQTDVDINPGEEDAIPMCSGVSSVRNEGLTRGALITLKAAGIAALEKVTSGFQFHSGVTVTGAEIADVRTEQFLTKSIAFELRHDVKKKGTATRRRQIQAKVYSFLLGLQKAERCVAPDDAVRGVSINVQWTDTFDERAANMGKLLVQVRTMPHLNFLVLETDMGTGTTVVVSR
jgi:hypothetical protein